MAATATKTLGKRQAEVLRHLAGGHYVLTYDGVGRAWWLKGFWRERGEYPTIKAREGDAEALVSAGRVAKSGESYPDTYYAITDAGRAAIGLPIVTLAANDGIERACGRDVDSGAYFTEFDVEQPEECAACGKRHAGGVMWLNLDGGEVYCLEHVTFAGAGAF